MEAIVYALLEICNEEGSTATVEGIRNAAFAKLMKGEVKALINSSLNGKSASMSVSMPADKLFTHSTQAIRLYNNGIITSTSVDFTFI